MRGLRRSPLELPAYRQLADPRATLAKNGLELCRAIEKATGLSTYYYLHRYYAFERGEERRRCPSCGGQWRRRPRQPVFGGLKGFEFRCDRCRLVSTQGSDTTSKRNAAIGAGRTSRRTRT